MSLREGMYLRGSREGKFLMGDEGSAGNNASRQSLR